MLTRRVGSSSQIFRCFYTNEIVANLDPAELGVTANRFYGSCGWGIKGDEWRMNEVDSEKGCVFWIPA